MYGGCCFQRNHRGLLPSAGRQILLYGWAGLQTASAGCTPWTKGPWSRTKVPWGYLCFGGMLTGDKPSHLVPVLLLQILLVGYPGSGASLLLLVWETKGSVSLEVNFFWRWWKRRRSCWEIGSMRFSQVSAFPVSVLCILRFRADNPYCLQALNSWKDFKVHFTRGLLGRNH